MPAVNIERSIFLVRGQKVLLDRDLAALYGTTTRLVNQAVRRNRERFPGDFILELTREEITGISQFETSSGLKYSKSVFAFTEPPAREIGYHASLSALAPKKPRAKSKAAAGAVA